MFKNVRKDSRVVASDAVIARICVVDQFLNGSWNLNDAGWKRNDIAALAAAQTYEQYKVILERLKELPVKNGIKDGTKLSDAFEQIRPRYCQTENEFVDFVGFMTEKGLANIEAAYQSLQVKTVEPVASPSSE